jgi:hypothetical protein
MFAANEAADGATAPELIGQGQAAHDMAGTNVY